MIPKRRYGLLVGLSVLVYFVGLFVTLFENDSAQFAVMAMRMVQENDYFNLIKDTQEYLDKPHLHFWLAALSFKMFGISEWAYRIPGVLFTLLAAYSTYGLGRLLYNEDTGKIAALVFMTSQTIVLSAIDVRTDAVLTGAVILSIWQIAEYLNSAKLRNLLVGAIACGLAFSTKGQIALLVIGIPLLCHTLYTRAWDRVWHPKVLLAVLVFVLTISPMLYAYYQQFDLHPEKVIRGVSGRSGIGFILWEQSFERLSGTGIGKRGSDYFFFFYNLPWVLIPWSILTFLALAGRFKNLKGSLSTRKTDLEYLTLGGIVIIFLIISFAQFKLPHYLNVMMPLFAVLTAAYLVRLYHQDKKKQIRINLGIQYFMLGLLFVASVLLCFFVFRFEQLYGYAILFVLLLPLAFALYRLDRQDYSLRIVTLSVLSSVMLNLVMNLHFYPRLLQYQGGSSMAEWVQESEIPVSNIFKVTDRHTWALDFYLKHPLKQIAYDTLKDKRDVWVYVDDIELADLRNCGFRWDKSHSVDQFRTSRLQGRFLNPSTRTQVVKTMHLVHLP